MKKILLIALLIASKAFSQRDELKIKINDLYIPDVPGFILADKAPSSVENLLLPGLSD